MRTLVFAHGANSPMDSDWMNGMARGLVDRKVSVVRFEFPYMAQRRKTGQRRPPDARPLLLQSFRDILKKYALPSHRVYLGGKSMGGRMASLVADELGVRGLVLLGFPFHAPGRPPGDRILHLKETATRTLIVQGERDPMGNREEVSSYRLSNNIRFLWLKDGDHDLKPRRRSGHTFEGHRERALEEIDCFITDGEDQADR